MVSHYFERDQVPGLISRPSLYDQPGRWCLPRRHWGTAPNWISSVFIFIAMFQNWSPRTPPSTMLDLLRGLKSLVKLSHVQIDSSIFRLHYTITVMACLAFSLLVTARQYVGNPIDCVHTKDIPEVTISIQMLYSLSVQLCCFSLFCLKLVSLFLIL